MELFGLDFQNIYFDEAVDIIVDRSRELNSGLIVTPNVDHIVLINRDDYIKKVFSSAEFIVADGMPIIWLSRLIPGKTLPERITGADLMPAICLKCASEGLSVAFIGAMPGVVEKAITRLKSISPQLIVQGYYSPPFGFENNSAESEKIVKLCREWKANVLFLCLGTPKQEKWAYENLRNSNSCGMIACVGAAADMFAGEIRRAPKWMQDAGLEWFWRLCLEPKRLWRRYLINDTAFLYYAVREIYVQKKLKKMHRQI